MIKKTKFNLKVFYFFLGITVLVFCFGCQQELLQTENVEESEPLMLKSGRITNFMVITKSETLPRGLEEKLADYGTVVNSIPEIGIVVLKSGSPNLEKELASFPEITAVVPDLKTQWIEPEKFTKEANPASIGSDESLFFYQWGMDAIDAPEAWNAGFTGKKARVFVLDDGIDPTISDLFPNVNTELSTSFVPDEEFYVQNTSVFSHGTHVAGIIAAADNGFGVIGVAPDAEIVAVKVLSEKDGSGAFSWINDGIVYAANNGADVINMSLGARFNKNGFYYDEDGNLVKIPAVYIQNLIRAQQRAINYAWKKGAVVVTSAGNSGLNADGNGSVIIIPAELQNVVSVSATAPNYWYGDFLNGLEPLWDIPASYTDFGKSLVDIAAPGGDTDYYEEYFGFTDMIIGTGPNNSIWFSAGTSFASPHVAGVAALIVSKNNGNIKPQSVVRQLLKTADHADRNGMSSYLGKGRVNAYRAVTE
ncbi:S8 family peptidase [Mariniphaga sp.]|uniref:S8 family peptidase n=1 Tax=Mariniphaga sp. TaxID=1954475 RepID=UPI0035616E2B